MRNESPRLGIDARLFEILNFEFVAESGYCKYEKWYFFDSSSCVKKDRAFIFGTNVALFKAYLTLKTACRSDFSLPSYGGPKLSRKYEELRKWNKKITK